MTDREKLIDILMDELPEEHPWVGKVRGLVDTLIANGVVVREKGEWKQGAIISGYQGIGKSTLSSGCSGYIDLESGNFFVGGERSEDWYIPYCQIAVHLAEQGYRVFVSSHAVVRKHLASMPKTVDLFVCFPSYALQGAWTKKLEDRYKFSGKDKDYRAWKNAEDRYAENIKELHDTKGFVPIVIHDMNYSLSRLLNNFCPNCGADMRGGGGR